MVKLGDLFNIEKGSSKFDDFIEDTNSNIAYVTTSGVNNGVKCRVLEHEHYTLYPEGTITVAMQGTVLASFLQVNPFYLQTHVAALIPKISMSKGLKLFYCYAIKANAEKFNFGRKANSHITDIEVPDLLEVFAFLKKIKKESNQKEVIPYGDYDAIIEYLRNEGIDVVKLEDLFDIKNGVASSNFEDISDKKDKVYTIPYLRPSNQLSNVIVGYLRKEDVKEKDKNNKNSLIVSTDGEGSHSYSYIYPAEFVANSNVSVLIPKVEMTFDEKMFYALCITANRYRYSYGRKPKGERLSELLIPNLDELPKWMEDTFDFDSLFAEIPKAFLQEGATKAQWYIDNIKNIDSFIKMEQSFIEKELSLYNRSPEDYIGLELDTSTWKEYKITDIFKLVRGKRLKGEDRVDGSIPYYAASKENNGLTGYIGNPLFIEKDSLIFTTFGDCYYVKGEFTASDEVTILKNKNLNVFSGLFFTGVLSENTFKFNYGRKAYTGVIEQIVLKLPSKLVDGKYEPDYDFMEAYIKTLAYSGCLEEAIVKLLHDCLGGVIQMSAVRGWNTFKLVDLFDFERGARLVKMDREEGPLPFVTAGEYVNGVSSYIKENLVKVYKESITIDMFGNSFVQIESFGCDDNIIVLKNKTYCSNNALLFISSVINKEKYRYNYGRQYRQKNLLQQEITLPSITLENGKIVPDFVFMEQYVKSLKYSKVL